MRGEDQLIQVAFGDEDSLLLTSHAVGDGVPFRYPIAVILDRLVRVAVAQCGGGILCADVDGLAVDPACPIPEIARLGQTLRKWKDALGAYFDTGGDSNGSTEAINGHYRAGQTHRQRLPQPHQLPTSNAPHRRRPRCLHPHSTLKSHQTVGGPHPRPHVHRRQADRPVATPRNTGCIMSRQS